MERITASRIIRPRSLATLVTDQIRDLIVVGRLSAGEQLSENALAEKLGTSRTPVREAFVKLGVRRTGGRSPAAWHVRGSL